MAKSQYVHSGRVLHSSETRSPGSMPEVDEPEADLGDDLADLGEGDVAPVVADLVADRDAVAELLRRTAHQVGDRLGTRRFVTAVPASIAPPP